MRRWARVVLFASTFVIAAPAWAAAPSDLDRAKQVYGEAMKLLDAKDYAGATAKFEQAYLFAPDKHLFNYNIASAAERAGDCRKAQRHYQRFLDLVPKHAERKGAERSLAQLATTCVRDDEGAGELSIAARDEREAQRTKAVGERALTEALHATQQSVVRYDAVLTKHGKQQPFGRIVRTKRRDAKKLGKLLEAKGITGTKPYAGDVGAPSSVEQACRQAASQEERNAAAYGAAYEKFDDAEVAELMDKLQRRAEDRHVRAFRESCPR
ncbi:MAG: hypothetical protein IAG13_30605 [Deltaproteobacteria bacterium]|nr:hypothetical protein [Nannocystaceae bacterium]